MKTASKIYLALVFVFLYAPIAVMILISFNSSESTTQFSGFSLQWCREMLNDKYTLEGLKNTLVLSVLAAVISTLIGTAAAIGISGMKKRWMRNTVMSVTNIPMMNPDIVTGISLMLLFVFVGSLTGAVSFGFWTLLIAHVTFDLPYVVLSVLPKIKQMDKNLPEAAMDLGCTPIQSFFKVELPLIAPGIITGFIMAFTLSFDDFVISNFTSGSSYETLTIHIYSMIKKSVKPDVYALSTVIFLVVLVLLIFYNFSENSDERAARKKRDAERRRARELARKRGEEKKIKL